MSDHPRIDSTGSRKTPSTSRRRFLKTTGAAALGASVAGGLGIARTAHAAGSDVIKIALIGCGGRGTGAAVQALNTGPNVRLVAMADAFKDYLESRLRAIRSQHKDRVDVPPERQFVGLDAYKKVLATDADVVLLCTPPGFRPLQFEAAVEAGKHVFMEKPVAVDGPGVRRVLAANGQAKQKGLTVAVGLHLRHETKHIEAIRRLHDGAIGPIKFLRAYFCSGGVWVRPRTADQTEMQYQVRNWYYFTWLSGDHIVEQHVHDLDVMNWFMKDAHPVRANGMGGRQVRIGKDYGEIFDHHAVEFDYEDGTKMFSFSRHIRNCWNSFSEHAHGTKGRVSIQGHGTSELLVDGKEPMRWRRTEDGHQVEQNELFAALAAGKTYNEGERGAMATMTAILGRMATYSGKIVTWDEAINSKLDLSPKDYRWDAEAPVRPGENGLYACAIPGVTKAW